MLARVLVRHQQRNKKLLQAHDALAVQDATLEDAYRICRVKLSFSVPFDWELFKWSLCVALC